jgi:hypothetical protein
VDKKTTLDRYFPEKTTLDRYFADASPGAGFPGITIQRGFALWTRKPRWIVISPSLGLWREEALAEGGGHQPVAP